MTETHPDPRFMQLALDACRRGVDAGQTPFAACIVLDGEVIACDHNRVLLDTDITAHGEMQTLRRACRDTGAIHFPGATIYSTTEPCPMCFTAIHWARIGRIVYGASVADAASFGFNELPITNATMKHTGGVAIELIPAFMRDEALALFRLWRDRDGKPY